MSAACEFCSSPGGPVLWQNDLCRVVRVDDPDYPGFLRVIFRRHAREMTDLTAGEREKFFAASRNVAAWGASVAGLLPSASRAKVMRKLF